MRRCTLLVIRFHCLTKLCASAMQTGLIELCHRSGWRQIVRTFHIVVQALFRRKCHGRSRDCDIGLLQELLGFIGKYTIEKVSVRVGVGHKNVFRSAMGILLDECGAKFDRNDNGRFELFLRVYKVKISAFIAGVVEAVHGFGKDEDVITSIPTLPVLARQSIDTLPRFVILIVEDLQNGRTVR